MKLRLDINVEELRILLEAARLDAQTREVHRVVERSSDLRDPSPSAPSASPPPRVPDYVLDRPSEEGLGGNADWRPRSTADGAVSPHGANPLLGHSGMAALGASPLAMTPVGVDSAEIALLMNAPVSTEQFAKSWLAFKDVMKAWLKGWLETHEVEVEEDRAVLDEEGRFIPIPPEPGVPGVRGHPRIQREIVKVKRIEPVPQPNRLELLRGIGAGRHPPAILQMARSAGGLQALVWTAIDELGLWKTEDTEARIDHVVGVAGAMVQICHTVFPDLQVVYDNTESRAWTRSVIAPAEGTP